MPICEMVSCKPCKYIYIHADTDLEREDALKQV